MKLGDERIRARLRYATVALLIASVPIVLTLLSNLRSVGPSVRPWQTLVMGIAVWYPFAAVAPFIDRRVRRSRPTGRRDYLKGAVPHLLMLAALIVAHGTLMYGASRITFPRPAESLSYAIQGRIIPDAIIYAALALGFAVSESRRRQAETAERLRAEVAEARLEALRQQLNPHFLFNTLNHIVSELRSLRTASVDPAIRMLLALSDLLRDVLRDRAQLIRLRDELQMVERYLEIERARFGERLHTEVTFEPRALDAYVPSLFLQPLVENALRHGVSATDGHCRVGVTIRTREERLVIEVRDEGPGLDPAGKDTPSGVGLRNTSERLRYLYGSDYTFNLTTPESGGLLVVIDLPLRKS